ncbi:MAG: hypothetical protein OD811_03815, partial [Alphaproteobacteria bacterium]
DETFIAELTVADSAPYALGTARTTVTIEDNDTASLVVSHLPADPSVGAAVTFSGVLAISASGVGDEGIAVGENGSLVFSVSDPTPAEVATFTFTDGAGGADVDGLLSGVELRVDGSLTWPAAVVGGNADVDFSVALKGTLPGQLTDARFTAGTAALPVVERVDVAFPRITFADGSDKSVAEGDAVELTINITPALTTASSVVVAITGTDTTSNDYIDVRGLVLPKDETSVTLTTTAVADFVIEEAETFDVVLSAIATAPPYTIDDDTATVTITDATDAIAKLELSLVLSATDEEISAPLIGDSLKLRATLRNGAERAPLTASKDIVVTPTAFGGGLWGTTAAPSATFTITAGESSGDSAAFTLASTGAGGVATLPVPTFTPDIGEFKSAEDVLTKQITLPNPDLVTTFNIVDSLRVPRLTPYIYPFDIASTSTSSQTQNADAAIRNPAVTQTITIETSQPAPAGGWQFALAASEAGIASGEVAPAASYGVPATLTIAAGDTTGMADITL